jgi:putative ATPase
MDLFEYNARQSSMKNQPLAERVRPNGLKTFVGQKHLLGKGKPIQTAIETDHIFSMILWGPPGCGKTTLARIIAKETQAHFVHFSAVLSGVKEIRSVIKIAEDQRSLYQQETILFVDEIHRFNKAQQDAFLHHVEDGLITLIGATTENPSFEVIAPLLSRCRVITMKALSDEEITLIIESALKDEQRGLGQDSWQLSQEAIRYLVQISDGDARMALNNLELVTRLKRTDQEEKNVTLEEIKTALQEKALVYDKSGESHYNLISALHKSMRGSDPDAAIYWLGRMLASGENPLYVARRMVRFAVEDIGNADPDALRMALNGMEAYRFLGSPEGDLALAQTAVYLATAPKSNAVYAAYNKVQETIKQTGSLETPLHIRNAPTKLMKSLGYGKDYQYAHDFQDAIVSQEYLPEKIRGRVFYQPVDRGYEQTIRKRLDQWRSMKSQMRTASGIREEHEDSGD